MELTGWTDSIGRYHEDVYKDQFGMEHKGYEIGDVRDGIYYKKVALLKNGECCPLFIDRSRHFKFNEWQRCKFKPKKGFAPRSINGTDSEEPMGGWHLTGKPEASWIADELANGEKRVWMKCYAKHVVQYERPQGIWYLAEYIMPIEILTEEQVEELNGRYIA